MKPKIWNQDISKFCPGIGRGELYNQKTIKKIIKQDDDNEIQILNENN